MKILVLTNLYPPFGAGSYEERCRQTVVQLQARGHEVRVLTSTHGFDEPVERHNVHRRLRLHSSFENLHLPLRRLHELERANHAVLRSQLAAFAPDVVHVWNLAGLNKSLILSLQESGRPVVYDVADYWITRSLRMDAWLSWWNGEAGGLGQRLAARALRWLGARHHAGRHAPFAPWNALRFDRAYFCSRELKDTVLDRGWPVEDAAVIPPGVETRRFTRRTAGDRCERLLYVGRFHAHKDPLSAIRALGRLTAGPDAPGLSLDLYGRGESAYLQTLGREVAELGLEHRVAFREVDARGLDEVYAKYDALLYTAANDEPFATIPLEAMAAGVPVIATALGGLRELARDGENALLYRASDVPGLAAQIRRLATDAALRRRLAGTAARDVAARHELAGVIDRIEAYLTASLPTPRS